MELASELFHNNSVNDYATLIQQNREDVGARMEEWRRKLDELEKCFEHNLKHINASFETWHQRMNDVEKSVQSLAEVRSQTPPPNRHEHNVAGGITVGVCRERAR